MNKKLPILLALISAAALFGLATPASKVLLDFFAPIQLAGLLYLGVAIGVMPLLVKKREVRLPSQLSTKNRLYLCLFREMLANVKALSEIQITRRLTRSNHRKICF